MMVLSSLEFVYDKPSDLHTCVIDQIKLQSVLPENLHSEFQATP